MTVYVEYALAENFVIDFALLVASGSLLKQRPRLWRVSLASLVGAGFAIICPLLHLSAPVNYVWKTAVGALMCLLATERVKTKKEWGRYALNTLCFFFLTFAFAGLLSYVPAWFSPPFVGLALAGTAVMTTVLCRALYQRRRLYRFLYECTLFYGEKEVRATGYLDSGNLAQKHGVPVCFVSPDMLYTLVGEAVLTGEAVAEELAVSTVNGDKKYALYKGAIVIEKIKKEVYFTASVNMVTREYKILLPAGLV